MRLPFAVLQARHKLACHWSPMACQFVSFDNGGPTLQVASIVIYGKPDGSLTTGQENGVVVRIFLFEMNEQAISYIRRFQAPVNFFNFHSLHLFAARFPLACRARAEDWILFFSQTSNLFTKVLPNASRSAQEADLSEYNVCEEVLFIDSIIKQLPKVDELVDILIRV